MKYSTTKDTAIICAAAVIAVAFLTTTGWSGANGKGLVMIAVVAVLALGLILGFRYLTARKQSQLELTGSEQYRRLADEYRRLADLAITAQEHTDLKLADVSVQLDYLRAQNESLQKILSDVE
jgi:uncharacterized protein HemX